MSHTWIIDSGATDHMTENRGIMFSFTLASKYSISIWLPHTHSGYLNCRYHLYSYFIVCYLLILFF